jgi:lipoate-protein ligase A
MRIGSYKQDDTLLIATQQNRQERIRVYIPDQVQVVLGRASKPETELHMGACMEDGVLILRRRGGGCAVVLDPGNVIVTVAEHVPGFGNNKAHFKRLSAWVIECLETLGVRGLGQRGISDLALGERKVAGSCLHRSRDTLLYSASLLVGPDISLIERYLKHPPREPDYRNGRPHRDFLRPLAPGLPQAELEAFARRLEETLACNR